MADRSDAAAPPESAQTLPPPKLPEHELRDRARAAKYRHKAAKARLKAHALEGRAARLKEKAADWESRADQLDGVVPRPPQLPLDE